MKHFNIKNVSILYNLRNKRFFTICIVLKYKRFSSLWMLVIYIMGFLNCLQNYLNLHKTHLLVFYSINPTWICSIANELGISGMGAWNREFTKYLLFSAVLQKKHWGFWIFKCSYIVFSFSLKKGLFIWYVIDEKLDLTC